MEGASNWTRGSKYPNSEALGGNRHQHCQLPGPQTQVKQRPKASKKIHTAMIVYMYSEGVQVQGYLQVNAACNVALY